MNLFLNSRVSLVIYLFIFSVLSGCAVHYYDSETESQHIWGIGHMVMKTQYANDKRQAIVRGVDLLGLGLGKNDEALFLSFGWDSQRQFEILNTDTKVELIWPDSDFLSIRLGSELPKQ